HRKNLWPQQVRGAAKFGGHWLIFLFLRSWVDTCDEVLERKRGKKQYIPKMSTNEIVVSSKGSSTVDNQRAVRGWRDWCTQSDSSTQVARVNGLTCCGSAHEPYV